MKHKAVRPNTPVEKIVQVVIQEGQGMVPVVSSDNMFLGNILAKDLEQILGLKTAGDVLASTVKSGEVRYVSARDGDLLDDALAIMVSGSLPFVPVVRRDGQYMGTVDFTSGHT